MNDETALVPYVPPDARARALTWAMLEGDVRRRKAMEAAAAHDAGALVDLTWAHVLIKGRQHQAASAHTLASYAVSVRVLLRAWREENLLHPSPDAGDRYVADLSTRLKPGSVKVRLTGAAALYAALRWARATTAEPFGDVHSPRDRTPAHERRQAYPLADVEKLLRVAAPAERMLILLCAHGGLRIAEALALEWSDCAAGFASFRVRHGKGNKERTVRCSSTLRAELAAHAPWPAVGPVVSSAWHRAYKDATRARYHLRRLCAAAGVPYLGLHSFRHSAATRLIAQSGNIQLVAAHLGHADINTAAVYAKMASTELAQQLELW